MAVQPDKRSWERQLEESGANLTERRRVGIYTLQAEARVVRPHTFNIRSDRPGLPKWYTVSWYPHDGWVAYDPRNSDDRFCTRGDPIECLRWWVTRLP